MRRNSIGALIVATSACTAVAAGMQQPPQSTPAQDAQPAEVTVIGCVQPTDPSAAGGGTADTKYSLTHAKPGKSKTAKSNKGQTDTPAGTSGKTTPSASQAASTYRLKGDDATLSPEVGHQVEIIAIAEAPETPVPAGTTGAASATAPALKVQTVRMIALTCPE